MISEIRITHWLARILQIGIIISITLVLIGGISFLLRHGAENLKNNIFLSTSYDIDILSIWQNGWLFSPIRLIELGLLTLVMAQIIRVALLGYYYTVIRDYWFMLFSLFILSIILYSLLRQ